MDLSIIIACYNEVDNIGKCLEAIFIDDRLDLEVIIADNESSDGSQEKIKSFQERHHNISLICEKDRGISHAFNNALTAASGRYVLMIGADDRLTKEGLDFLASHIKNFTDDIISFANTRSKNKKHYPPTNLKGLTRQMIVPHPSTIVRRRFIEQYKFPEKYHLAMDYHFFVYMFQRNARYSKSEVALTKIGTSGVSHRHYISSLYEVQKVQKEMKIAFSRTKFLFNTLKFICRRLLENFGLQSVVKFYQKKISLNKKDTF